MATGYYLLLLRVRCVWALRPRRWATHPPEKRPVETGREKTCSRRAGVGRVGWVGAVAPLHVSCLPAFFLSFFGTAIPCRVHLAFFRHGTPAVPLPFFCCSVLRFSSGGALAVFFYYIIVESYGGHWLSLACIGYITLYALLRMFLQQPLLG